MKRHKMANQLRSRIGLWGRVETLNELEEVDYTDGLIKTVYCAIVPQYGTQSKSDAETKQALVTHKVILRYLTGKALDTSNWFIYNGKKFDIKYSSNPYETNEVIYFYCEEAS